MTLTNPIESHARPMQRAPRARLPLRESQVLRALWAQLLLLLFRVANLRAQPETVGLVPVRLRHRRMEQSLARLQRLVSRAAPHLAWPMIQIAIIQLAMIQL